MAVTTAGSEANPDPLALMREVAQRPRRLGEFPRSDVQFKKRGDKVTVFAGKYRYYYDTPG